MSDLSADLSQYIHWCRKMVAHLRQNPHLSSADLTAIQTRLYYDVLKLLPVKLARTLPAPPLGGFADYVHLGEISGRVFGKQPKRFFDVLAALESVIEWFDGQRGEAGEAKTPSDSALAVTPAKTSKGVPLAEAEVKVREWLSKHAKDNPAAITRDLVAKGTGVSPAQVSRTAAWKAFRDRRDAEKKPRPRERSLSGELLAVIPSPAERPDELAALIEEQEREREEEERRYKCRSENRSKPF
jgi:hypothetical protein